MQSIPGAMFHLVVWVEIRYKLDVLAVVEGGLLLGRFGRE